METLRSRKGARSITASCHQLAASMTVDVLTGFLSEDGKAYRRPVGVAIDQHGALPAADDVDNVIWRVIAARK